MRRILNSKLTVVALVIIAITLISSVTWAATQPSQSSGPSNQITSSVVEIQAIPLQVEVGGSLEIAGSGFVPAEYVLFEIITGKPGQSILLQGGQANDAGAFLADTTVNLGGRLPEFLTPGIYTIAASTVSGVVATSPLVVVEEK